MKKLSLLKTMFLLCALIAGSTSAWAESKPWSGDDPETTLDLQTITSSTMGTWYGTKAWYLDDDYLIVSGYESYKSVGNQTWITHASVGSSGSTWDASDPFKGSSYYTNAYYATIQSGRYLLYKVTNLKSFKLYGKNNSTSKYLDIFIYTKSGDDYTKVEEIKYTTDNNVHIWENSETLDPEKTYYIYITGVGNSNSRVFEVAFERNSIVDTRENAGLAYTVTSQTVAVGNVLAAPALTNPHDLAVTYGSEDESIATVDASGNVTGVSKGITTITASFAGNETYKPGSASYTISVTKVLAANSIMYESFDSNDKTGGNDGTWSSISITPDPEFDLTGWTYTTAYGAYQCVRTGKGGSFTSPALGVTGDVTLKFKMGSWSGDTNNGYVDILNGGTFEDDATQKLVSIDKGAWKSFELTITGVTPETKIKFSDNGNNKRLFIDEVEVLLDKASIAPAKEYTTYVTPYALDFTSVDGLKAFVATEAESTGVTLEEPTAAVPAGTPLVLKKTGSDASYDVPVAASATDPATNLLKAGPADLTGDGTEYILSNGLFYQANAGTLAAGKAYLKVPAALARELVINWGETTGIGATFNDNVEMINDNVIYDLSGRRVENPTKGIYIVNGKKVVIR